MSYSVEIVPSAERQFRKLAPQIQNRITPKLLSLENQPRPHDTKKLHNTPFYRIRIGDYRVIYSIDDSKKLVKILDIGHRKEIYR